MIKTENTEIHGIESAIRGMRNPMNSWGMSDTKSSSPFTIKEIGSDMPTQIDVADIGGNDLALAVRLCRNGSEHRKFLRFIHVTVDITAPLYWWKQADTYKFMDTNSCSTMHKLSSTELTADDFSHDVINESWLDSYLHIMNEKIFIIKNLKKRGDDGWKEHERSLYQMLLESYNQKRTVTLSYETIVSMCLQRTHHKLQEWNDFVEWARRLPYMSTFINSSDWSK